MRSSSSAWRMRAMSSLAAGLPGMIAGMFDSPAASAASREFSFSPPLSFSP
jgi:hypothetical protein